MLLVGLNKLQMVYLFKFDPGSNQYLYITRYCEGGSAKGKGANNVLNVTINQYTLPDSFGDFSLQ